MKFAVLGFAALVLLAGCAMTPADTQLAGDIGSAAIKVATTADPAIAPDVALACVATTAGLDAAVLKAPDAKTRAALQPRAALAHASCDKAEAQRQLTANDQATVQPDGGSSPWLQKLLTGGMMVLKAATLASALL